MSRLMLFGLTWELIDVLNLKPDALLIYWISEETQTLYLERIGSHSELFR
jgi:mRNA-degrading endonuclease YafQ of YafQ-DinJ toxin-antitoxin module